MPEPHLLLDVPLVGQMKTMSCWYASACMVAYYREAGPRLGLPKAYMDNTGTNEWSKLAQVEGMSILARPSGAHVATKYTILTWLRDNGPIWCAGDWYGAPHVIVLTGISGDTVHINDPDDQKGGTAGRRGTETVGWFNSHQYWTWPDAMLCRPA